MEDPIYVNQAGVVLCAEHLLDAMVDANDEGDDELVGFAPVEAGDHRYDAGDCIACRAELQADAYSVASAATY